MKIEGASQQGVAYSSPEQAPVRKPAQVTSIPKAEVRTSNLEIVNHKKQNIEYRPTVQEKLIIESIEMANRKILGPEKEFEFSIHKETKQIMVKILDKNTREVIREIPAEKVLDAVAHMWELAGLFMDEKR